MASIELNVVVGVIRSDSNILITKRPEDAMQGGLWEFPGGKLEQGESPKIALMRELKEEVNIDVIDARPLIKFPYEYNNYKIILDVWIVNKWQGEVINLENQQYKWISEKDLDKISFPLANRVLLKAIQLPSLYLICPIISRNKSNDLLIIESCINAGVQILQIRCGEDTIKNDSELIFDIVRLCRKYKVKILLNSTSEQAVLFNTNGVHLSSQKLLQLDNRPLSEKHLVAASCHNLAELEHACRINADFAVLSPVNHTQSHPDVNPLGWDYFSQLTKDIDIPVFALGGMQSQHIRTAWNFGAQGIAVQSYIWSSPDPSAAVRQCVNIN